MGKQSNKIEKRRRRLNYLARKKNKAKEAAVSMKPRARKPAPPKKAPAAATPAPAPPEETAPPAEAPAAS